MNWLVFGAIATTFVIVFALAFRSLRRWPQTPPSDAETREAEAQLWATKNVGGGGQH
jgi:hypothetical protein